MPKSITPSTVYLTSAIPYVNAPPHIGFGMELVLCDVLARYRRLRGDDVRFCTGTDDNSLKNVRAAEAEGISTRALVDRNAAKFAELRDVLDLSFDDFLSTSADPRHRPGAEKLWTACARNGDIYKKTYRGLYCVGCEQFYAETDLDDGRCPEHQVPPEVIDEENYFFRLSAYGARIEEALESGALRIVPEQYRNEVLTFVRSGLQDLSISRSSARARGWGIEVPGDPEQVMYVWFDALGNYITALDYATDGSHLTRYWKESNDRIHVLGKGITRFHAVYWPALLLSAGLPLPTKIAVHGYLTVQGKKIGKSLGNAIDPTTIATTLGSDSLRYFLCRHIRSGRDGDFSEQRAAHIRKVELADQLGNLLNRTINMTVRYFEGRVPAPDPNVSHLGALATEVRQRFELGFEGFRLDDALSAAWGLVEAGNKFAVERAPWTLAKKRAEADNERRLAATLYDLLEVLRLCSIYLQPFVPQAASEIRRQLGLDPLTTIPWEDVTQWGGTLAGRRVQPGPTLFPPLGSSGSWSPNPLGPSPIR